MYTDHVFHQVYHISFHLMAYCYNTCSLLNKWNLVKKQGIPGDTAHTWNVRKEGYIPHGKLWTFTCGGLRSIGPLCPQVYASRKFFLCGRPQYFHMQVRSCPQRDPRMSADISADICGHPHGLVRTSAWMGADVCGRPHGWVRTSAGPEDLLELLPCCVITCWSYVVLHDHMPYDLVFNICST